jgi:hypothetical protein
LRKEIDVNSQDYLNYRWKEKGIIVRGFSPCAVDMTENHPGIESLKRTEWDNEFEVELRRLISEFKVSSITKERLEYILNLMRNRLIMGSFRYGLMADQDYSRYDLKAIFNHKISKYAATENLECLIDALNMMLISYVHGKRVGEKCILNYVDIAYKVVCIFCSGLNAGYTVKAEDDKDHAQERIAK